MLQEPCKKRPEFKEIDAKKATIVRFRKYAKEIKEERRITMAKIKAIREHDLSNGTTVTCIFDNMYYVFPIRK